MPLIDHYENYKTEVNYLIKAELSFMKRKPSPLQDQETKNPRTVLKIVRILASNKNISYKIFRIITFERKDGFISKEPPIEEQINIEKLEKIIEGEEILPIKTYPVYASLSPCSVDIGD